MQMSAWKPAVALACGLLASATGAAAAGNLIYHGGPVIVSAKAVFIFWGPSFSNAASPDFVYAQGLQAFRNQLGTSAAWQVLTQYSGIQLTNLGSGTPDWFDSSTPPTNVTDAKVQSKVTAYLASHAFNSSAVYQVVIPSTSYSSSGSSTSCGGPSLAYCAYHSSYASGSSTVQYMILPYPSCSACQGSGWTTGQDTEHFFCFEIRDVVTDPTGAGWFDNVGLEIDPKCSWAPPPPVNISTICGKAWSNSAHGCV